MSQPPGPKHDTLVVLDFGSQYSQLITRRLRELGVYTEMLPWNAPAERVLALDPKGYILSGGPASVYAPNAPTLPEYVAASGRPVLGICYGMQLLAQRFGGHVAPGDQREYGPGEVQVTTPGGLFDGLADRLPVWMSHGDRVEALPPGFTPLARSDGSPVAAMGDAQGRYGIQFHPEVTHTRDGKALLANFVRRTGARPDWTPGAFIEESIAAIQAQVGDGHAVCALSGGVDSSVAATLVARALGDRLTCIFVDHGLLRQDEAQTALAMLRPVIQAPIIHVDASARFLSALEGITDPEQKRRVIGELFIRVFEDVTSGDLRFDVQVLGETVGRVMASLQEADYLVQGTLYPDVIESAEPYGRGSAAPAAKIKTHHNVGGLPTDMQFQLVEPLRSLFKDEVRAVGLALGLPPAVVYRQPFPGPGLAVRILGEVTPERLATLRAADAIVRGEIEAAQAQLDPPVWQFFAVLVPVKSVGVQGDFRTYADLIAIRAVTSEDGMTADWARLPHDLLGRIAACIVNAVPGVNRVAYDITSKPPATIEWE
ncbi:MAG: glutamine-hydrolyzing GMP synthase [Anaerolineae bacterium]|nr:glutamine-hydrolyzing GMP synthase [Anaerolineae bacterium]